MRCKKCKRRHNVGGFTGAAMTPFVCSLCGKEDVWNDTLVPKICCDCARQAIKNKDRCHWCGEVFNA